MFGKNKFFFIYLLLFLIALFLVFFVWIEIDEDTNKEYRTITTDWLQGFKKWLDIAWWARLTYRIDYSRYEEIYTDQAELEEVKSKVETIILQNVDSRISALWVSDYTSYIQSIWEEEYMVVEIWWVTDIDTAKDIIWRTVELEFKVPYEWEDEQETLQSRQHIAESILTQLVNDEISFQEAYQTNIDDNFYYDVISEQKDQLDEIILDNFDWIVDAWESNTYPTLIHNDQQEQWHIISYLWQKNDEHSFEKLSIDYYPSWITAVDPVTNQILNAAFFNYASVGTSEAGRPVVLIHFNSMGAEIFCNLTDIYVNEQMAIFVWWEKMTDPVIREQICWWTAQIDWNFSYSSARELADDLNDWAMPAPLILAYEEMISPTLWDEALQAAIIAWAIWFVAVFFFMFFFYWIKYWLVAIITLITFVTLLFGFVKLIGYALSLSGIAAIILSIWIAVDANVLIFERVREEINSKKWVLLSIQDWFTRSLSAIRDWNLTTGLIGLLLFMIWTNVFAWFWTMMLINIILILFVVVPLTRILLEMFTAYSQSEIDDQDITIKNW